MADLSIIIIIIKLFLKCIFWGLCPLWLNCMCHVWKCLLDYLLVLGVHTNLPNTLHFFFFLCVSMGKLMEIISAGKD